MLQYVRYIKLLGLIICAGFSSSCVSISQSYLPFAQRDAITFEKLVKRLGTPDKPELVVQRGHAEKITSMVFSPDGQIFVSRSDDAVKLWDAKTGKELHTLSGYLESIAFSLDGKFIAGNIADSITIWDVHTGREVFSYPSSGYFHQLPSTDRIVFTPDNQLILAESNDICDQKTCYSIFRLWNVLKDRLLWSLKMSDSILSVSFSPDGQFLAVKTGKYSYHTQMYTDYTIRILDVQTSKTLHTFTGTIPYTYPGFHIIFSGDGMMFSGDGKMFADGGGVYDNKTQNCDDCSIKLWNPQTGRQLQTLSGHNRPVTSVAFSPDSQFVVSGAEYSSQKTGELEHSTVKIWDSQTGKLLYTLPEYTGGIGSVAFSPDGQILASGGEDNSIKLWDRQTGKELSTLSGQAPHPMNSVAFDPKNQVIASGSADTSIKLWDIQTGTLLRTLAGHADEITSVIFSPNGQFLASEDTNLQVTLWNTQTGKTQQTISLSNKTSTGVTFIANRVGSIAFSSDEQLIATSIERNTIKLWDVWNNTVFQTLVEQGSISLATFSPDGQQILSSSNNDRRIKLWDVQTGQLLQTFGKMYGEVNCLVFRSDGQLVGISNEWDNGKFTSRLWDVQADKKLSTFTGYSADLYDWRSFSKLSPDGQIVASTDSNGIIKLWNGQTGKELHTLAEHSEPITSFDFSPNGQVLASAGLDGMVVLWEIRTGKKLNIFKEYSLRGRWNQIINVFPWINLRTSSPVEFVVFNPNGQTLSIGGWHHLIFRDSQTGQVLYSLKIDGDMAMSGAFSPDGEFFASSSVRNFNPRTQEWKECTVELWDAQTGKKLRTITQGTPHVRALAFSPDGQFLLGNGEQGTIEVWDIVTGSTVQTLTGHSTAVDFITFHPNNQLMASHSLEGSETILWDIRTGKAVDTIAAHQIAPSIAVVSPDKRVIASANPIFAKNIFLWDIETGKLLHRFSDHFSSIMGFSSDGQILASGGQDIILWDVQTGKKIHTLRGHSGSVRSLAFSPNHKLLVSGGEDGHTKFWDVQTGRELASVIAIGENDWITIAPNGLFDASPGAMQQHMHWVWGTEPIEFDQLKIRYYEPGLLAKILNDEPLRDVPVFADIDLYPELEWLDHDQTNPVARVRLTNQGGGIGKIAVFINNKEMVADARGREVDPQAEEVELTIDVTDHPFLKSGEENVIEVKAWNAEGYLVSRGLKRIYEIPEQQIEPPHLWAIVAGVADYQGEKLDLRFAANDAEDMAQALHVGAKRLFGAEKVHLALLTSPKLPSNPSQDRKSFLSDLSNQRQGIMLPTRTNLIQAFEVAKGAKSTDILVAYLAGHGVTHGGLDGDYYYLTADAWTGNLEDPAIRTQTAISSQELTELLKDIPALKQVLILDTCASGRVADKLTEDRTVPSSQIRALERMKDRTGLHILAGSAADAVSYEASRYGQGILTYSLLLGMKGAALREEEFIDISKLFEFAADKVPELARDIGGIQRPILKSPYGGASFDIGRLTVTDKSHIPLSMIRPLVLRASFQEEDDFLDRLGLTKYINNALRELSTQGRHAPVIFIDTLDFPDAYVLAGRYRIQGETVHITINLFHNEQKVSQFTVIGDPSNLKQLTAEILEKMEKEM